MARSHYWTPAKSPSFFSSWKWRSGRYQTRNASSILSLREAAYGEVTHPGAHQKKEGTEVSKYFQFISRQSEKSKVHAEGVCAPETDTQPSFTFFNCRPRKTEIVAGLTD
jgi:hypothetical protein